MIKISGQCYVVSVTHFVIFSELLAPQFWSNISKNVLHIVQTSNIIPWEDVEYQLSAFWQVVDEIWMQTCDVLLTVVSVTHILALIVRSGIHLEI